MTWTWVGRIFSGRGPEPGPAPDPAWLHADVPMERDERLMVLLEALGGPLRAQAAEQLRGVVADLPMAAWVRMDEGLRRVLIAHYGWEHPHWLRNADDVRRLYLPPGTEAAVLGLLACAPSGYVREAAVQRLALLGDGGELPPLLVRANDWVHPVRSRALDALRARVVPDYAAHWVRALPLVLRLRGTGRTEARPLVEAVLALLRAPDARDAVRKGMHALEPALRRACFRILLDAGGPGLRDLVGDALLGSDEQIRHEAARAAASLEDDALDALLPRMLADRFPAVRRAALGLAARRMGIAAVPALRDALLDRGAGIRADARAAIERLEPMDFAAFYRARVAPDAPRLAEAVAGLGETGTAADADLVSALLDHPRPRVRAGALRALPRLAGDAAVPALLAAVGDASSAVSRTATDVLRPRVARADAGGLVAWMDAIHPAHVRRNALSLLAARSKWDGIPWIIQSCGDADPLVQAAGREQLTRWRQRFNRSFWQPTPVQQERIREALVGAGNAIDRETAKWLRFATGIGA
ncbi:MAG TPA: HEAT repeat domain-containing protein [Longimicrobium sp.]|nr:HEAT repeat domain-containing protein [Longimicrobium sp.]